MLTLPTTKPNKKLHEIVFTKSATFGVKGILLPLLHLIYSNCILMYLTQLHYSCTVKIQAEFMLHGVLIDKDVHKETFK